MLDSHISYETPEGVELKLQVAGPLIRALAWFIDLCIRSVIYIIAGIVLSYLDKVGQGFMLIGLFLMEWLYPTLFEALRGATPGKAIMNIYVVMDDGTALSWQAALTRNLLRTVDFLPFLYILGFIFCIVTRDFKRIGDIVAGTLVVYRDNTNTKTIYPLPESSSPAKSLPLNFTAKEQRIILQFIDNKERLSSSRQKELVNILEPVLHCKDDEALITLEQYATWIKGGSL